MGREPVVLLRDQHERLFLGGIPCPVCLKSFDYPQEGPHVSKGKACGEPGQLDA